MSHQELLRQKQRNSRLEIARGKKKFADLEKVQKWFTSLVYHKTSTAVSLVCMWTRSHGVPDLKWRSSHYAREHHTLYNTDESTPSNWSFIKCCLHLDPDMPEETRCRSLLPVVVCSIGELVLVLISSAFTSSHPLAHISRQSQEIHDLEVPSSLRMTVWDSCSESRSAGSCKKSVW